MVLNTMMIRLEQNRSAEQARWGACERAAMSGRKIP